MGLYHFPSVSLSDAEHVETLKNGCAAFAARYLSLDVPGHVPVLCIIETPFGEVLGMAQRVGDFTAEHGGMVIVGPAVAHPEWITLPQADKISHQLWRDAVDYVYLARGSIIEAAGGQITRTDVRPIHDFAHALRVEEWHERHPVEDTIPAAVLSQNLMAIFRMTGLGGAYTCGDGIQPS